MGGCCGAVKTGQKSLPDKKKSLTDVNQEKSNGKEAVPGTETSKTPAQEVEQEERRQNSEIPKQELIVAPVKVTVNATEPVKGGGVPVTGAENVMDLETAVAPFEGVISSDQPQLDIQGNVASTDSELLLPYQIPFNNTTNNTIATIGQEEFQLRIDEPQLDAAFQDADVQLSIKEGVLGSAVNERVDLDVGASGELNIEEPVSVVEKSFSLEGQGPPEGILPYVELLQSDSIQGVTADATVPLPAATAELDAVAEWEPVLAVCPPADPEPPFDSQFIAICPPDPSFGFSELEHQLSDDLGQVTISESVCDENEASLLKQEAIPASVPGEQLTPVELQLNKDLVEEEVSASPGPAPVQEIQIDASLGVQEAAKQPDQPVVDEHVSASAPFEVASAPELHHEPEPGFAVAAEESSASQKLEDMPPPVPQELVDVELESGTLPTDFPQETVVETVPLVEVSADMPVTPLLANDNAKAENEAEIDVAVAAFQLEQSQATEPDSYQVSQTEEQLSHQELGQEPQSYQEHKSEEQASYQGSSASESIEQVPASVAEASDVMQSSENVEVPAVIELVSEQAQENRDTWWQEGGQLAADSELPVLELVPDQAQQSRQAWWEQSGSDLALNDADSAALSPEEATLPPIPLELEFHVESSSASIPSTEEAVSPPIPAEVDTVSPSSDSFPEVIPEPLPSSFDQDATETVPEKTNLADAAAAAAAAAAVESPLSVDGSTIPTENGAVSQSSDEAYTPASVVSPEGSTPTSNLSPEGVDPAASSKEPISAQA